MGMGAGELLRTLVFRPKEFRSLVQYKIMRDPLNDIETTPETSGWDRESMRTCWKFLDQTSRSFAFVIKELQGDLCRATCIFYLVLRALDTIEDDMTLKLEVKTSELRTFHKHLNQPGWHFDGSGPDEKDRQVLVEFFTIIEEYQRLDEKYQTVIANVCQKMGSGMAHYAEEAANNGGIFSVSSLADFDLYCHYVAGLVGEGLSALFSASGLETPELAKQLTLSNSMGLMLQKVNILRDFREDIDDGRLFWPKAIWARNGITDPRQLTLPENNKLADQALSAMTLDTLQHAIDSLQYLSMLKNQSIFNFCAIPQLMAMATLDECFGNLEVFQRNVKIRRSLAADLIVKNANPISVGYTYVRLLKNIHRRMKPSDPSFIKLATTIGRIEQWVETRYPSWLAGAAFNQARAGTKLPETFEDAQSLGVADARTRQLPTKKPKPDLKLDEDFADDGGEVQNTAAKMKAASNESELSGIQQIGALLLFASIFFAMIFIPLYYIGWFSAVRVKMPMPFQPRMGFF